MPPPRTVGDVTAILGQQERKYRYPEEVEEARARATEKEPLDGDAATLATFYYQRGLAADIIGLNQQGIEDLTRAAAYVADTLRHGAWYRLSSDARVRIPYTLALAEFRAGRFSRAFVHYEQAIKNVTPGEEGWLFVLYEQRVGWELARGDVAAAERTLRRLRVLKFESRAWASTGIGGVIGRPVTPSLEAYWDGWLARAHGAVLFARGRISEAIAAWQRAVAAFAATPKARAAPGMFVSDEQKGIELEASISDIAVALAANGQLMEAEIEARRALLGSLRKEGRSSGWTARAINGLAHVLFEQGRYAEAEALARAGLDIQKRLGAAEESLFVTHSAQILVDALVAQRRWNDALAEYDHIRERVRDEPVLGRFRTDPSVALTLIRAGRAREAVALLHDAIELTKDCCKETAVRFRGLLGMAYAALEDRPRAFAEFKASAPLLVKSLSTTDGGSRAAAKDFQVSEILGAYVALLADLRATPLVGDLDAVAEAFRLSDAVRGRSVTRALDASAARSAVISPELADLVRRDQDARRDLTALRGNLASLLASPPEEQNAKLAKGLRDQIAALSESQETIAAEVARRFPAYAQLTNPAPATIAQVQTALRPQEALIATYVGIDRTFIWAIPKSGPVAFAVAPLGDATVRTVVGRLRAPFESPPRTVGEFPDFDVAAAYNLYRAILESVKEGWERSESLLIVPHGALAQLPFAVLPTRSRALGEETAPLFARYRDVPWLIRTHAMTTLPSAGALTTLRSTPPGAETRRPFVGFGDPYFSQAQAQEAPMARRRAALLEQRSQLTVRDLKVVSGNSARLAVLPPLPDTADEIRSIAKALNADLERDVFLGVRANERMVKTTDLARYKIVGFATHALAAGDLDGLEQPALALTAPEVAGIDGDGLLTLDEVLALRLDADWVVLSACNTASGDGAGAEAISGLGRAFFYAGARALLVTHWPVETTSARALTSGLFERYAAQPGLSRAKALQQTMNALIDDGGRIDPQSGKIVFSYAHPVFWAAFTLVGDGG